MSSARDILFVICESLTERSELEQNNLTFTCDTKAANFARKNSISVGHQLHQPWWTFQNNPCEYDRTNETKQTLILDKAASATPAPETFKAMSNAN